MVDYLLLDTYQPGETQVGATGAPHDWDLSRRIVKAVRTPVILAGGLGPQNVAEAIRTVGPAGVDSKTHTERDGGSFKDIEQVRAFVRIATSLRFDPGASPCGIGGRGAGGSHACRGAGWSRAQGGLRP